MYGNKTSFDPFDVRSRLNPVVPKDAEPFNAWEHIGRTAWLDPRRVKPMEGQPRENFGQINSLAQSLKESGQKTAILVHPITDPDFDVELTAGERRTWACREAGIMIRAEIRSVPESRSIHYVDAVVENFNREDLTLFETVKAVNRLLAEGYSQAKIARLTGKKIGWISNHATLGTLDLRVLKLLDTKAVEQRNQDGRKLRRATLLPMDLALQVAKLDPGEQYSFAEMLIEENVPIGSARGLVRRRLKAAGKEPARELHPQECFTLLDRETRRAEMMFAQYYHEMDQGDLRAISLRHDDFIRESLARRLRTLSGELFRLAETVDQTIDPTAWHPKIQEWLRQQGVTW